ncbi:hypothetical protein Q0L78_01995, partial [Staphylococcus aureus]|nr:hypothetical protein [Staphylococcus aureus]
STGNGSWRGPNTEKLEPQFQQAMEVGGAPTQRNWNPNFNRQWKLGTGPNTEADGKSDFNNVRVGVNEFNFVKNIISVPLPMHESNYVFLFLST